MSARRSVSRARAVMSPRFPMGVATTYNPGSNGACPMSRPNAVLLAILVSLATPAFSADPGRGTTDSSSAAPQAAGAAIVVAAITRDGASTLARSDCARRPVLALNEPQAAGTDAAPNLYTVSLSLENEARQVALLAVENAGNAAVVISSGSPLSKRVQEAFEREWTRDAGQIAARI